MFHSSQSVGLLEQIDAVELRSPQDSSAISLESRLIAGLAGSVVDSAGQVDGIWQILNGPDVTHPERLALLQERLGQYSVDINLLNTLVRKAVGTAETLLRSS
ncbi:type III secretion system inner rod subunit SctI [Pseudomonas fuscovaginae UPB0736]|uniref:Type III secretion system major needle protein, YscF/MxiH/PrgI family n=1 Tax=Pseudomonas asplenii TaxID=53407 RepID=A0A1H2ABV1_9PSED|nr:MULTISPECIES: type III secretion system inner rod subunit SctI [Pseudomonas]UUQ66087.1 type III secretion system inner rod subunit SctI [Pseudomonas fuscovaginae UPB0736]UZE30688.1 type III secretion system inner rod subunit SctI [Pseudomonas asplenii]SDT43470.1 type III secretion system major needle protein, YscF/MxiH/PrgI family [Pseudomonas asplenii]SEI14553.1 type III secretion system major needle protein, YscF/MxiH/PrgI family [Pseudomonas fuscovaginae]